MLQVLVSNFLKLLLCDYFLLGPDLFILTSVSIDLPKKKADYKKDAYAHTPTHTSVFLSIHLERQRPRDKFTISQNFY